jgi:hypothetical protein
MEAHSWVWQRAGKRCLKVGVCCQAPDDTRTGRSRILKFDLSCCKLLQAGQGILWIRISRRRSCILRAELLCRVQNADLVGRHHQAERERKVQHATTSWTSLQWVCNPLTLKPQALSHQLCLSQGLDMSTDQHHPQSSTIIHNHPQSSCIWGQSNCTLMGGTVAAFTWQMWPCKTVNCFAHLARICTNLMTQLRILCKSWNSDDMIMICDDAWSILKRSELPLTRLSRRPPWSLHQDLQSTPERLESFWIFWHLLASIYLFYFQFKAPGGFAHFLNLQISRNLQWITSCRHSENDMWAQQRRVNENHGPVNKPHITANHSKSWAPTDWISSSMSPFSSALRCWSIARAWPVLEKRL